MSFFKYRNPSTIKILAFDKDMDQCVRDWRRDCSVENKMFLNGRSMHEVFPKIGNSTDLRSAELLNNFWMKEIINKLNLTEDKNKVLLSYFAKYMHQGGALNLLETSLIERATEKECCMFGRKATTHFTIKDGQLFLEEDVNFKQISHINDSHEVIQESNAKPKVKGMLRHKIYFDEGGALKHEVDKLEISTHGAKAEKVFDPRGLLDKIRDLFNEIFSPKPIEPIVKIRFSSKSI